MARFGFVGATYQVQARSQSVEECINWLPENSESATSRSPVSLIRTPGLSVFTNFPAVSIFGEFEFNGRAFVFAGTALYEVFANGTNVVRGNPGVTPTSPVQMACSPTQLLILANGNLYVFTLATNAFVAVNMAQLGGANSVAAIGYTDSYFVALLVNSNTFQLSVLLDGTTWPGTGVNAINIFADNVVSMVISNRDIWFFGRKRSTVYYDTGNVNFPYLPIPGVFIQQGSIALNATVELDNSVFWIGGDEKGSGIAWRANGYTPQRISTFAVEFAWQQYATIQDAIAFPYQEDGHSFYVVYFPTANATWAYDCATGLWHKRASFFNGQQNAFRAGSHMFAFQKHLVGDIVNGLVYEMNRKYFTDNGATIQRVRIAPHINVSADVVKFQRMQLICDVGKGPSIAAPCTSPQSIILQDANNVLWQVTILDNGTISTVAIAPGAVPNVVVLNDSTPGGPTTAWQLAISVGGVVQAVQVPFQFAYTYKQSYPLCTTGVQFLQSGFIVSNAGVVTAMPPQVFFRGPQLQLSWSNDGGVTFKNPKFAEIGQLGQTLKRVIWRRLGKARDRVFKLIATDPAEYAIVDALLDAEPGYKSQESLSQQFRKIT